MGDVSYSSQLVNKSLLPLEEMATTTFIQFQLDLLTRRTPLVGVGSSHNLSMLFRERYAIFIEFKTCTKLCELARNIRILIRKFP